MQKWSQDLSKLSHVEIAKLEKDGLDVIRDIERYAQLGFKAIIDSDFDRLKFLGLYVQRPKTDEFFMLRVKIPGGVLQAKQVKMVAELAKEYGRDLLDITTRQSLQFHWIKVENLPDIFNRLKKVGLTTVAAAGDCPRNIVSSPLAGVDPEEFFDASHIVRELNRFFEYNRDFSNLPRKFKIAITTAPYNSIHSETNDVAFTPAEKDIDGEIIKGFHVAVGGGLSAQPQLAQEVNIFVRPEEVLKVAVAVATIFRDYGYREKRNHARLKFLVEDWGIIKFTEELLAITGPFETRGTDLTRGWNKGFFHGVHKQKTLALNYVGLTIPAGRLSGSQMTEIARVAETYGNGEIRSCNSQDLVLINIPDEKVEKLLAEEVVKTFSPDSSSFLAHAVTCTGKEFCPFAVAETKHNIQEIANYLDAHVSVDTPIRISISGCKHSCGQPQIADIGLQGNVIAIDGKATESFEVWIGGVLGPSPALATKLSGLVITENVGAVLTAIIQFYKDSRSKEEAFSNFVERVGHPALQEKINTFVVK
jgi:ferredoxin-nitrite reductase